MDEYISRNALMRDLSESLIFSVRDGVIGGEIRGANKVIDRIKAAPTADVVEVRHGEWILKRTGRYGQFQAWCTACGQKSGIGGIESNQLKPYCPNCGAKMDGGSK